MTHRVLGWAVLCWMLLPGCLVAQDRELRGMVVHLGAHDEKVPEVNLTVTIRENGNSHTTNSQGLFRIVLPENFKPGDKVTLLVDKPDWRIHLPVEGETRVPADLRDVVEGRLLPVGSMLFLSHAHIEKLVQDIAEKSKQQLTPENKPVDFTPSIKDYAVKFGFSIEQVQEELTRWQSDVKGTSNDLYKLGLAAFLEKNFSKASQLSNQAGTQQEKRLAAVEKAEESLKKEKETLVEEIVRAFRLEGDSHANSYRFDDALIAYQRALSHVSKTHRPQDWAATLNDIGNAHWQRGLRATDTKIHAHLTAAVTAYRQALEVYTRTDLPQGWAMTQNNLGLALQAQGERTAGERGTQLLAEAVTAYRQALEVYTRTDLPQDWATTQNNLGNALQAQGERTAGERGTQLLAEAVTTYRQALEVYTRTDLPQDWATPQNNLGAVLRAQGERTAGERGTQLLAEAVTTYRQALEVRTRADLPQGWAMTQNNLGLALQAQGERTAGERGTQLLAEAVTTYRQALEVYTRTDLPQDWAMTQNNLGNVLQRQGERTAGERGTQLLAEAVTTYRQALEVRTRADLPQDWATTQNNLGNALQAQGERTAGERGTQLLAEAVTTYRQALEVYTRTDLPQDWATPQNNLGAVLRAQGERTAGERGTQLLAEAVTTYRQALEVYTRTDLPQGWAMTQNNLGAVLRAQGERTAGERGTQLLAEAVTTYRQALEVRTFATLPLQWAQTHNNLAKVLVILQDWANAVISYVNVLRVYPDYAEAYQAASALYHDRLFQFPQAFILNQQWLERHPDDLAGLSAFAENHLTTARFAECDQRLTALLANPEVTPHIRLALQALDIANLLALDQAALVPGKIDIMLATIDKQSEDFQLTWSFGGTLHFISQHAALTSYRYWLQQFFGALTATDRQALVTGLHAAQASFPGGVK